MQGLVDCIGVDACGGGNTLVPRSHSAFSQWRRDYSARVDEFGGDSYFECPVDHVSLGSAIVPRLLAGDLLLWDSRTVHCSTAGPPSKPPCGPGLARLVAFVCLTPSARADEAVLERRRSFVQDGVTTTHVPEEATSTTKMAQFYPHLAPSSAPPVRSYVPCLTEAWQWHLVDGRPLD